MRKPHAKRHTTKIKPRLNSAAKTGFGQVVVESLQDFVAKIDRGETITMRSVRLNLQPRRYDAQS